MDKNPISKVESNVVVLAVGYVRTAQEGAEAEAAAEHQKARIEAFAGELGVKVADWYVDLGHSGRDFDRSGLQAVLAAAQEPDHGIGMALVYDWARLSRCPKDLGEIATTLSGSGIRLVSVTQGEYQRKKEVWRGIMEEVDEFYRDQISEDTRWGLRRVAEQGYWVFAQVPYGYRKVEVKDGGRRRCKLEIDPETAEVVRVMYDRDGEGASPQAIATELNDEGVPSPTGGPWTGPQVRRVLCNLANAGIVVVGKNSDESVTVRDAHPAIVSEAVVEKVKAPPKQGASQ